LQSTALTVAGTTVHDVLKRDRRDLDERISMLLSTARGCKTGALARLAIESSPRRGAPLHQALCNARRTCLSEHRDEL
jgi:hypothetical protein